MQVELLVDLPMSMSTSTSMLMLMSTSRPLAGDVGAGGGGGGGRERGVAVPAHAPHAADARRGAGPHAGRHARAGDARPPGCENIPTCPASDWSVVRIYPCVRHLIGGGGRGPAGRGEGSAPGGGAGGGGGAAAAVRAPPRGGGVPGGGERALEGGGGHARLQRGGPLQPQGTP
eukprot:2434288-Pyramimonas_sp.AAC.1